MNILQEIIETKRTEVAKLDSIELLRSASTITRSVVSFSESLRNSSTGIITEFKRRSPSKGVINGVADVSTVVSGYQSAGASAVSVLTDREYFGGSAEDFAKARAATNLPLLRKDFIIDNSQICEARIWGADVVLLIASALSPSQTTELAHFARSLSLEVLLEIHGAHELGHINEWVNVVGVNNRNLATFETSIEQSIALADHIPKSCVRISESGISDFQTVRTLRQSGYRGFLMGENFMKNPDPAYAAKQFINQI